MRLKCLVGSVALLPSLSFGEVTWNGSIGAEKRFSDNPRLLSVDERTDTTNVLNATFSISVLESLYQLSADYSYDKEDWQHDTFDTNSNLQGTLQGNAVIVPARLNWMLYHNQTLARTESQLPDTPDNREERTVIATGPSLVQVISNRSRVELSSLYSEVQLEESSRNDSHRVANSVNWFYLLSDTASFSINFSRENAIFDSLKLANYSRESSFIQLTGSRPLFDYGVSLGANKVMPRLGDDQSGKYADLFLAKSFSSSSVSLTLTKELTDSIFGSGQVDSGPGSTPVDSLSNLTDIEIIERDTVQFSFSSEIVPDRLQMGLNVSYQRDRSEESGGINQQNITTLLTTSYALNPNTSFINEIEWGEETFKDVSPTREDVLKRMMLGVNYSISPRVSSSFEIQYRELDSDVVGSDYDEFSSLIRLDYRFGDI